MPVSPMSEDNGFFILDTCVVPFTPCEPTDVIPRSCQLNTDVPQVTQLLNLAKTHKPEIKCRSSPVTMQETGILLL